ncbi:MAG TPA: hypothetical protein VME47_21235 [Acetobacteraceae bacterium]|nr:hypothetical protein [Acetobacteraceae bacterium]
MWKLILFLFLGLLVSATAAIVLWFHARRPPNCTNPDTIALVRHSLIADDHLPPSTTLEDIRTIAGGPIAFRFVCEAFVAGVDPNALPPGTPLPGAVHYTSELTPDGRRHEVTVDLEPILKWMPVQ